MSAVADTVHRELPFEDHVFAYLTKEAPEGERWLAGTQEGYDKERALYTEDVFGWLRDTQPEAWDRLERLNKANTEKRVLDTLVKKLGAQPVGGTLEVLRQGFSVAGGGTLSMSQALPEDDRNETVASRYAAHRLRVVRQLRYNTVREWSIDLVFFVNGLPVATWELKSDFTQHVDDAVRQYRNDRSPKAPGGGGRAAARVQARGARALRRVDDARPDVHAPARRSEPVPAVRPGERRRGRQPAGTGRLGALPDELSLGGDLPARQPPEADPPLLHLRGEVGRRRGRSPPAAGDDVLPALPPVAGGDAARRRRPGGGGRAPLPARAQRGLGQDEHDRVALPLAGADARGGRPATVLVDHRRDRPDRARRSASRGDSPDRSPGRRRRGHRAGEGLRGGRQEQAPRRCASRGLPDRRRDDSDLPVRDRGDRRRQGTLRPELRRRRRRGARVADGAGGLEAPGGTVDR